jgi:hypothetical protein
VRDKRFEFCFVLHRLSHTHTHIHIHKYERTHTHTPATQELCVSELMTMHVPDLGRGVALSCAVAHALTCYVGTMCSRVDDNARNGALIVNVDGKVGRVRVGERAVPFKEKRQRACIQSGTD